MGNSRSELFSDFLHGNLDLAVESRQLIMGVAEFAADDPIDVCMIYQTTAGSSKRKVCACASKRAITPIGKVN